MAHWSIPTLRDLGILGILHVTKFDLESEYLNTYSNFITILIAKRKKIQSKEAHSIQSKLF